MPKFTPAMVEAAILGFEEQKRQIDLRIAELRLMETGTSTTHATAEPVTVSGKSTRKTFSAATRKAMAAAQRKRWAAKKGVTQPSAPIVVKTSKATKKKGSMSPETKAKMILKLKKYWADKRAASKKAA